MSVTHVVGVDPGLVHTGVVVLSFYRFEKRVVIKHEAVVGPNAAAILTWLTREQIKADAIFIEGYRPRSNLNSDARMTAAVRDMNKVLPKSKVLNNTGVKKVIKQDLMELLNVWRFATPTHHQDLRSAARIALLGMSKDDELNELLANVVLDHLNGRSWDAVD